MQVALLALGDVMKEFPCDPDRVYLTGLSMGGYGSWYLAQKYPHTFAAMVIVCGGIHPPVATLKAWRQKILTSEDPGLVHQSLQDAFDDFAWSAAA